MCQFVNVDYTETCINEAACWYEVSPSVERGTRNILFFLFCLCFLHFSVSLTTSCKVAHSVNSLGDVSSLNFLFHPEHLIMCS